MNNNHYDAPQYASFSTPDVTYFMLGLNA